MVQKEEKKRLRAKRRRQELEALAMSENEHEDMGVGASTSVSERHRGRLPDRRHVADAAGGDALDAQGIELDELNGPDGQRRRRRVVSQTHDLTGSSASDDTPLPLESVSGIFSYPINLILRYVRNLRSGHEEATKRKVIRRTKIHRQVFEGANSGNSEDWHIGVRLAGGGGASRRMSEADRLARQTRILGRVQSPVVQAVVDDDHDDDDDEAGLSQDESDLEVGEGGRRRTDRPTDSSTRRGSAMPDPSSDQAHRADQAQAARTAVPEENQGGLRGWIRKWRTVDKSLY